MCKIDKRWQTNAIAVYILFNVVLFMAGEGKLGNRVFDGTHSVYRNHIQQQQPQQQQWHEVLMFFNLYAFASLT